MTKPISVLETNQIPHIKWEEYNMESRLKGRPTFESQEKKTQYGDIGNQKANQKEMKLEKGERELYEALQLL